MGEQTFFSFRLNWKNVVVVVVLVGWCSYLDWDLPDADVMRIRCSFQEAAVLCISLYLSSHHHPITEDERDFLLACLDVNEQEWRGVLSCGGCMQGEFFARLVRVFSVSYVRRRDNEMNKFTWRSMLPVLSKVNFCMDWTWSLLSRVASRATALPVVAARSTRGNKPTACLLRVTRREKIPSSVQPNRRVLRSCLVLPSLHNTLWLSFLRQLVEEYIRYYYHGSLLNNIESSCSSFHLGKTVSCLCTIVPIIPTAQFQRQHFQAVVLATVRPNIVWGRTRNDSCGRTFPSR